MSIAILAQAQIAKMYHQHELPGYVTISNVPMSSVETMEFSPFFGACAAMTDWYGVSDQDKEDAHLVHMCYQMNVRISIMHIIGGYLLDIRPPEARNLISGQGGWGMTSRSHKWVLMNVLNVIDNVWWTHVRDWAAFEGPSPINITAVRMAGYLWLGWLRLPRQSWKPLTHCTYVDPPICDPEIQIDP